MKFTKRLLVAMCWLVSLALVLPISTKAQMAISTSAGINFDLFDEEVTKPALQLVYDVIVLTKDKKTVSTCNVNTTRLDVPRGAGAFIRIKVSAIGGNWKKDGKGSGKHLDLPEMHLQLDGMSAESLGATIRNNGGMYIVTIPIDAACQKAGDGSGLDADGPINITLSIRAKGGKKTARWLAGLPIAREILKFRSSADGWVSANLKVNLVTWEAKFGDPSDSVAIFKWQGGTDAGLVGYQRQLPTPPEPLKPNLPPPPTVTPPSPVDEGYFTFLPGKEVVEGTEKKFVTLTAVKPLTVTFFVGGNKKVVNLTSGQKARIYFIEANSELRVSSQGETDYVMNGSDLN